MIPYGRQAVTAADIEAVVEVLRSDMITQGPVVPRFESRVAAYCGASRAVAANSGTSALHLACRALDLAPGDVLWTSPITFVASANCARYCGAAVDFVDIDPATGNLCPNALEDRLRTAERAGRLPKVVMPVHFAGQPCDMAAIGALAERYGFRVIEDASHALGATFQGEAIGNGRYSDITVFSFHPVKLITTGEGGMAVTADAELADRMTLLRSHGITRDAAAMEGEPDGPWSYQQIDLGYNYRMTDIQAALGVSQLERLDDYIEQRHELAAVYDQALAELPVRVSAAIADTRSALHLYVVRVDERRRVFDALRAAGIGVNVHYIPVHTQPYYQRLGFAAGDFPHAEQFYAEAISLPLYPTLEADDQQHVIDALQRAVA